MAPQALSMEGEEKIARLLPEMGVEVNMQRGEIGSALQAVSSRGYKDILRSLIWKRAEVKF